MYSHAEQGFVSCLGGAFLSHSGCLYILSSIYSHASGLEQIWSILLSLALPFRWRPRGPGLFSALSTVPSPSVVPSRLSRPFPRDMCGWEGRARVWNCRISAPPGPGALPVCIHKAVCLASHHDLLGFFFIFNKEQIWVLIYKSWVFPSPGTPKTSKAFSFSICL